MGGLLVPVPTRMGIAEDNPSQCNAPMQAVAQRHGDSSVAFGTPVGQ